MTAPVRAFVAIEIPDSVKSEIRRAREMIRTEMPRARWVRIAGQHLTLKFLGEAPRSALDGFAADLGTALAGRGKVHVALGGAGFFPSPQRPRVAWLGGTAEGMAPVVEAVEDVGEDHGFSRERRPWSLHLTQARLDRPWPADAVAHFLEWGRDLELGEFVAGEVVLFSSRLQPGGAVYTALERMSLE
jgi:2'-5' RNA ligase